MTDQDRSRAQMLVVVILAAAVALSVVIFAAGAAWTLTQEHLQISDAQLAFLTTSVGAIIGGLVTYLGVGRGQQLGSQTSQSSAQPAQQTPKPESES
jgi:Mn2+/Fe2+ NRAMP family transporter